MKNYRIIDANINRASEGLRVLEDVSRFRLDDHDLTREIKELRHGVRKSISILLDKCLSARDSLNDTGFKLSQETRMDDKSTLEELLIANCKRAQEALRTVEEVLKLEGYYELSKQYEYYRFRTYTLEKRLLLVDKMVNFTTDIYCLTGEEYSLGRSNEEVVSKMLESGIKIIQYREKEKKSLAKYKECLVLREMTKKAGATFIIDDDIALAMAVDADGVHIGQDDLPIEEARKILGQDKIIGLSTHSPMQADDAVKRGADYIGVGPIFTTKTKKDVCAAVGLEYLDYVVKNIKIPFVAIGGIKEHNIQEVKQHGASLIALVTEIVGAEDIAQKIKDLREALR